MSEYHKIETLFERDMEGSKKLIEGKYRNECVEFLAPCKWIFTEKVDGTNVRRSVGIYHPTKGHQLTNSNTL